MSDWDHRQLCPDGACVGLIGPDGTCKVCGRAAPNWGDERKRGMVESREDEDEDEDDDEYEDGEDYGDYEDDDDDDEEQDEGDEEQDEGDEDGRATAKSEAEPGEWSQRKLCPDGACVGVLGADGKCKVCGRSAA